MSAEIIDHGATGRRLRHRIARAGSWVLIGHASSQIIRLATNVLLARMLSPDMFGLMSVVYILMIGMALFSDLGINRIVVQSKRGRDPDLLDTAFTIQVLRGLVLGIVCLLVAGSFEIARRWNLTPTQSIYSDQRLPWVVAAFSLVAVLAGFESIRIGLAKRDMQMRVLTKIDLASQISAAAAMIAVAWEFHSIWALVAGALVAGAVRTGLGHMILPGHREKFRIVSDAVAELLGSGKWIVLASILGFIAINGDRLLLGGISDASSFGLYTVAFMLVNVLQNVAFSLCSDVAYPAIAEVYLNRPDDFSRTMQRFQYLYDGLVTFLAAIMMTAGPGIIHLLYDTRYQNAGPIMVMLALGAVGLRYQIVEQAYQATGNPQYITAANFIRLSVLIVGILLGHHFWGFDGAVAGVVVSQYSTWPLVWWFKARHGALIWRAEAMLFPALAAGTALGWVLSQLLLRMPRLHFPHL